MSDSNIKQNDVCPFCGSTDIHAREYKTPQLVIKIFLGILFFPLGFLSLFPVFNTKYICKNCNKISDELKLKNITPERIKKIKIKKIALYILAITIVLITIYRVFSFVWYQLHNII